LLDVLSMIGKILASGQLGKLSSFVSPTFFEVMPARALWAKGRQLLGQSRDREAFRLAVAARSMALSRCMPQIALSDATGRPSNAPSSTPRDAKWQAPVIVELYFRQLFDGAPTLLDLRRASFGPTSEPLLWRPAAWVEPWSPDFIGPLREIYKGFYQQDEALFQRGLATLKLQHSADLFREHFGGDQAEVRFEVKHFVDTFHAVFTRCKKAGTALHPDFLPLGIYLAALYDHLEELKEPVNVAQSFERATRAKHEETIHA
jgi:hypothetical protein